MKKKPIDKNYVFSILSYNANTGNFTWLVSRGTVKPGKRAGALCYPRGKAYIQIKIDKSYYKGHQLAWLFSHGDWPAFDLDHIDGDGTNNAIRNLRPCTMGQNKANSKKYKNNKSGFKNVTWNKKGQYWYSTIQCNGKRRALPARRTPMEAHADYALAAKELFGDFARVK